ncbi:thioesterase II family protein [Nocardiopsis valliformis]|uniref:thioesterase II family protein n=1 Tax=Nocardiopsis valliformis TaxID=239974 RepID=UPI00034D40A5|nr:thioesterase domain-containing protein [Nocardiopsis valliformis]
MGTKWLLREPSDEAPSRLLCFPYSGCGASMFRQWPERLGRMEVLPLQLPWRENRMRDPHYGTYEQLATDAVEEIGRYLDRPYAVFGHCGGALPAFETVLRIGERGLRPPERCFVSSQVAPQDGPYGRFLGLDSGGLRGELLGLLSALGSDNPSPELVDLFLEVLEADLEANRRYRKEAAGRVPCPVTAIGWSDDTEVPYGFMGGWSAWGETDFPVLKGTHYTFLEAPRELQELLAA